MHHPYRQPQDPPPAPRDPMLLVLWVGGVLAALLAMAAIVAGVLDARHPEPSPVATDAPRATPTPTPTVDDPPPQVRVAPAIRPSPATPEGKTPAIVVTDWPIPPPPKCAPGTHLKMGMMQQWICCPEHADCD